MFCITKEMYPKSFMTTNRHNNSIQNALEDVPPRFDINRTTIPESKEQVSPFPFPLSSSHTVPSPAQTLTSQKRDKQT
jgi:hypothetical protein